MLYPHSVENVVVDVEVGERTAFRKPLRPRVNRQNPVLSRPYAVRIRKIGEIYVHHAVIKLDGRTEVEEDIRCAQLVHIEVYRSAITLVVC